MLLLQLIFSVLVLPAANASKALHQSIFHPDVYRYESGKLCVGKATLLGQRRIHGYVVNFSRLGDARCAGLDIFLGGIHVYHDEILSGYFYLGLEASPGSPFEFHFTGRKSPELVISKWSGGMHCCYSATIFSLRPRFAVVAEIDTGNFPPNATWNSVHSREVLRVNDDILAEEYSDFARTPSGSVALHFFSKVVRVTPDFAKKQRKNNFWKWERQWRSKVATSNAGERVPPEFLQALVELLYAGRKRDAESLFRRVWPGEIPGGDEFWAGLLEKLQASEFFRLLP